MDISLKTLKLLLCFCLYKADVELFKWASVEFGALERIAFAFHPPQTAIQPKQNVRSKQQPHTSVPSGCLIRSSTLLFSKCPYHDVAACTKGWEQSWSCQTPAHSMGSHGLAFQLLAHRPWVNMDDWSLTDPVNQKCWIFWLYTFDNLTSLLNWGNHDEALI